MARAHFVTYLTDDAGNVIPGALVTVREPDTSTAISETIFATDDTVGNTIKGNPFTADADGRVEIWLNVPKVVDLFITKTGFDPRTLRATAHQLTASTLTVLNEDAPLSQRSGLNFGPGFTLADDAGNDETEVELTYGGTGDMPDSHSFGQSEDAGTSDSVSRADHKHPLPADPVTAHESTYDHTDIATHEAHLTDTTDAHDASAVSVADAAGHFAATDVEAALAEAYDDFEAQTVITDAHAADVEAHNNPIGMIAMWGAASEPDGWLLCNGQAVSRTTYSDLFALIGTSYGNGNGSSTFNVPNMEQRFPLGKADSGTGDTLGETGGEIDHNHSFDAPDTSSAGAHTHDVSGTTGTASTTTDVDGAGGQAVAGPVHTHTFSDTSDEQGAHVHTIAAGNTGTENPPYLVVNFIIKADE